MAKINNYTEAIKELEIILKSLQEDQVAIDQLESKVKRANKLIVYCQEVLRKAEKTILDK